jgi:hypothetical protein
MQFIFVFMIRNGIRDKNDRYLELALVNAHVRVYCWSKESQNTVELRLL